MIREQELFWKEIQKIQGEVVNVSLTRISEYKKMEDFLIDVTYETIYELMELLDGYKNKDLRGDVIDKNTGASINKDVDLHNFCEDYLKCSNI